MLLAFQAATTPVNLCVGIRPLQQSTVRGQASQWEIGAWTENGTLPDARISLTSSAGAGAPSFVSGCGSGQGTATCDLGAVDSASTQRLFQAEVTVPVTATTVPAVSLTVAGSAASLAATPAASASLTVLTPASPVGASLTPMSSAPAGVAAATPSLTSGGSAAGLFPTLAPKSVPEAGASPVANVSRLAGGSGIGSEVAEGAGLAALGVAGVLAVTRMSLRRPAPRHAAGAPVAAAPPPPAPPAPKAAAERTAE